MEKKAASGILLTLLMIGMLTLDVAHSGDSPPDEILYVNEFTADYVQWSAYGVFPYLDAVEDGNYIEGTTDGAWMGYFGFEDIIPSSDTYIMKVVLEGYTSGPYNELVDYDIYSPNDVWLGSLYATGSAAWVAPRWVEGTLGDLYPDVLTVEGLDGLQVKICFYDPNGYGGIGNTLDALRLKVWIKELGHVYIRADGSIDPPSAPISTADSVTYTFTGNIAESTLVTERDNIVVDGAGYTLQGFGRAKGADITGRSNVTIENLNVDAFDWGVALWESSNINITGNTISNCGYDIHLGQHCDYNNITRNHVTTSISEGILVGHYCDFNNICRNSIDHNMGWDGIILVGGSYNTILENNITDNHLNGITIALAPNNTVSANNIARNKDGIKLHGSSTKCNNVSGNIISEHTAGTGIILQVYAELNTISENTVRNNMWGIALSLTSNNVVYHNNFVDNTQQVSSDTSTNVWDDGYPSGGNYWSDCTGVDLFKGAYQNIAGSDGVYDTPYTIDPSNKDNYPLAKPWSTLRGDVDSDGDVDYDDFIILAGAYGSTINQLAYRREADIDSDGDVDYDDFIVLAGNYGKTII